MAEGETPVKSVRTWRDVAETLSHETDSDKIAGLSQELIRALDEDKAKKQSA